MIFKLMFANNLPRSDDGAEIRPTGFEILLSELGVRTGISERSELVQVARPLWTLVHGASMLTIDDNYLHVKAHGDTDQMISRATELILAPYPTSNLQS